MNNNFFNVCCGNSNRIYFSIFIAIAACAILITLISLKIFLANPELPNQSAIVSNKKCKEAAKNCTSSSCQFFNLCSEASDIKDCTVYDCGNEYKISAIGAGGIKSEKIISKSNSKSVEKTVGQCQGFIDPIEKKSCDNGKATAKVKVVTESNCEIIGFTGIVDDKSLIAVVQEKEGVFSLSFNKCGAISRVTAIGKGGVLISEMPAKPTENNLSPLKQ